MYRRTAGPATIEINVKRSGRREHQWKNFDIPVSDDMALIGGGGMADDNPGALLTASYPNEDHSRWLVSSKDHVTSDPHYLTGYSIGLNLVNVDPFILRQNVVVFQKTSEEPSHTAKAWVTPPNEDYVVLGGGFQILNQEPGQLATASFPVYDTDFHGLPGWEAHSKDHQKSFQTVITAYAIC